MPDLTTLPLEQLLQQCSPLTQRLSPEAEAAWQELQRRALLQRNDAAWDALVARLWSAVLVWIYEQAPDVSPATAELLSQQAIWTFRQEQIPEPSTPSPSDPLSPAEPTDTTPSSSSFPPIITTLQDCLGRLLDRYRQR